MLAASNGGDVEVDEAHVRVRKRVPRGRGEVGQRVPMPITTSASRASGVGRGGAGGADRRRATAGGPSAARPCPACVSATGMPVASANAASASVGLRVAHAAAGDDQRPPRGRGQRRRLGQRGRRRAAGGRTCQTRSREQRVRPVVGLGLHVLRQRQGHRAGVGGIGQHPHRLQQRGRQQSRAPDPVEVAATPGAARR